MASMTADAVVEQLLEADLTVAFIGFLPGFAYLEGLPGRSGRGASRGRRRAPRSPPARLPSVAGSPASTPGPHPAGGSSWGAPGSSSSIPRPRPSRRCSPGDTVRLRADNGPGATAGATTTRESTPTTRPGCVRDAPATVEVMAPGLLSMVQDLGRIGVASLGVPRAGAADPYAGADRQPAGGQRRRRGRASRSPRSGPRLRFDGPAHVAVVGRAEASVDGRPIAARQRRPGLPGPGALDRSDARRPAVLHRRGGRVRHRSRSREPVLGRAHRSRPRCASGR